ncbi:MAG: hypothetical protein R2778_12240 [Saprospiraceae bacterium]
MYQTANGGSTAYPVVFMLHGTSGDGESSTMALAGKEVGETEGIITSLPFLGRYCINDPVDGIKTSEVEYTT